MFFHIVAHLLLGRLEWALKIKAVAEETLQESMPTVPGKYIQLRIQTMKLIILCIKEQIQKCLSEE